MRLRKGALNAYGSLDGPMLDDDVELEVGEDVKFQMSMKLFKDVFFVNGYYDILFKALYLLVNILDPKR